MDLCDGLEDVRDEIAASMCPVSEVLLLFCDDGFYAFRGDANHMWNQLITNIEKRNIFETTQQIAIQYARCLSVLPACWSPATLRCRPQSVGLCCYSLSVTPG